MKKNLPFLAVLISILAGCLILTLAGCLKISPTTNTTPNFQFNEKNYIVIQNNTTVSTFKYQIGEV